MTAAIAMCLLFAGRPETDCASAARPAPVATHPSQESREISFTSAIALGALQSSSVAPRNFTSAGASVQGTKDSIWNGVLIGAALGLVAIVTTAAEAPPSGKATTVVMLAALGGYVDSRLAVTGIVRPGSGRGRQIALRKSLRF